MTDDDCFELGVVVWNRENKVGANKRTTTSKGVDCALLANSRKALPRPVGMRSQQSVILSQWPSGTSAALKTTYFTSHGPSTYGRPKMSPYRTSFQVPSHVYRTLSCRIDLPSIGTLFLVLILGDLCQTLSQYQHKQRQEPEDLPFFWDRSGRQALVPGFLGPGENTGCCTAHPLP